jgi:hypothetical protein
MNTSWKLFKDLTEEEVLAEALEVIPEYRERIRSSGEFDLDRCVRQALNRIERLYKSKHGIYATGQMNKREREELARTIAHYQPILYERIGSIRQKFLQSRRVSEINAATARALIQSHFHAAGLDARVTGQLYRARVEVNVPPYHVRFYLNYKKMLQEGVLENSLAAVQNLVKGMEQLGYGAVVERR